MEDFICECGESFNMEIIKEFMAETSPNGLMLIGCAYCHSMYCINANGEKIDKLNSEQVKLFIKAVEKLKNFVETNDIVKGPDIHLN